MVEALHHRGPDDAGVAGVACPDSGGEVTLGTSRLSLLDLTGGVQPFLSPSGALLAYNGEIFNYRELTANLVRAGRRFRTTCDTEVLMAMLETHGTDALAMLDGMFSLAFYDGDRLILARDPAGIKPLFWAHTHQWLVFASEIKALLRCPLVPGILNRRTLFESAIFGYPLGDSTYFDGIDQIRPGTALEVRLANGALSFRHIVYSAHPVEAEPSGDRRLGGRARRASLEFAARKLRSEMVRSIEEHMVSDHPVGILLSGGVDSSALVGAAREAGCAELHTFTLTDNPQLADAATARLLASQLGHHHHEISISSGQFVEAVPRSVLSQEAPVAPTGLEFLAQAARSHVKAALCGEGADELFAGYWNHREPISFLRITVHRYLTMFRRMAMVDGECALRTKTVLQWLAQRDPQQLDLRMWQFELQQQLVNSHLLPWDLGTMASSLEVRLPYLSQRARRFVGRLPFDLLRPLGSKALVRELCHQVLPRETASLVCGRAKRGFPSSTLGRSKELREIADRVVPDRHIETHPLRWLPPRSMPRLPATARPGQAEWKADGHVGELPEAWGQPSALNILLADMFLMIFLVHRGVLPEGLSVWNLYQEKEFRRALSECLEELDLDILAGSDDGPEGKRGLLEQALL